jgi:protoporphyrinogen oxidase
MTYSGDRILIIGGGIAGIVAGLRASACGQAVTIVEKQAALGGLLASVNPDQTDGHSFDLGTHIPAETGEPEIDHELFGWMEPSEWQRLPELRPANYWNNTLSLAGPFLDLRTLAANHYSAVLPGLLRPVVAPAHGFGTLAEQIVEGYGREMLDHVFEPILRKFYGVGAAGLSPDAHLLFGLSRFVCLDPEQTRDLKREPALDAKLAFHSVHERPLGSTTPSAFYPRCGGVGRWVAGLERILRERGVEVRTESSIKTVDVAAGVALTSDDCRLNFDRLYWSLPAGMLLRASGNASAGDFGAPALSAIILYHFVVAVPVPTTAHYVTCYDPALRSFRVTVYGNLQPEPAGPTRLTVEVIAPQPGQAKPAPAEIFAELHKMGLVDKGSGFSACHVQILPGGFPIQTPKHRSDADRAAQIVERDYRAICLLGRASGQSFFMRDVIRGAWQLVPKNRRAEYMVGATTTSTQPGAAYTHHS